MILTLISLLVVFTSVGSMAYKFKDGNTGFYLLRHSFFLALGIGVIYVTHLVPYKYFSRIAVFLLYISVPLLIITLFMGEYVNSANRQLKLFYGLSFQTSDLAKLALVMFIARMLSKHQNNIGNFKDLVIPLAAWIFLICGLILPANLSTAALLFLSSITLMFIGRVKILHLITVGIIAISTLVVFTLVASQFTNKFRIETWLSRIEQFQSHDDSDKSFQSDKSKSAVATGGIMGKGPGHSEQRYFLPHPYSDFIYAIIIEEYGFMGGFIVLLIYLILLYRTVIIVRKSPTHFGALLAIGLAINLVYQALINMGVCVGLMPVTGQPLPFISWGGTSIIFTSISIGGILSVSRSNDEIQTDEQIA